MGIGPSKVCAMNWLKLWERANRIASCDCEETGRRGVNERTADWAANWEHWNDPLRGHLIAASLLLDGAPVEDLP